MTKRDFPAQAVAVAIRLLQMTAAAGHFLQENRLYKAFRLLQRVARALPEHDADEDPAARWVADSHDRTRQRRKIGRPL